MLWVGFLLLILLSAPPTCLAVETPGPEEALRTLVRANAEMDFATMANLMAHDVDAVGYMIGGKKYVGWTELARDIQHEFETVARLEIPITELKVWTRGDTAWFAMELDYIRYVGSAQHQERTVFPLRETGVLERRAGGWVLVAWHESLRSEEPHQSRVGIPEETRNDCRGARGAARASRAAGRGRGYHGEETATGLPVGH